MKIDQNKHKNKNIYSIKNNQSATFMTKTGGKLSLLEIEITVRDTSRQVKTKKV